MIRLDSRLRGNDGQRERFIDAGICVGLAVLTIGYLRTWPHDFLQADEGTFLYEAKRVVAGDVIYRDFFDVIMPTSIYAMAAVFSVFGTSIDTARTAMAVVHAGIVVAIFSLCRQLAVRRSFAIAAAFAHVAIAYPAFSITTPHWLGTLGTLLIASYAITLPWPPGTAACFGLGALTGALFVVQHQRGIITGIGLVLVLVAAGMWRLPVRELIKRVTGVALGVAVIAVPVLLLAIAAAGARAVFEALILHPLVYYRSYNRTWWGEYHTGWVYVRYYVYPEFVRWVPLVIPFTLAYVGWHRVRRRVTPATVQLGVIAAIAATAVAAIAYFPDHTHLALLMPLCFVLVAMFSQALLGVVRRVARGTTLVADALAIALCVWLAQLAHHNIGERLYYHPYPHETAFGHIDYRFAPELDLVDGVREAAAHAKNRELFCYTACAGLYLTSDTTNPTPYQLMIPGYNRPDQFDQVVRILESRRVDLVVSIPTGVKQAGIHDPINTYLRAKFEVVPISATPALTHRLWRRKGVADTAG